jgi:hypothetical protein
MLDFRSHSAHTAYYKQPVDYGRLLMMVISSILLFGLILSLGRPRHERPLDSEVTIEGAAPRPPAPAPANSNALVVGVALVAAALCVVAAVMFALFRMAGPRRVHFSVHDAAHSSPDFTSLKAQPLPPTPRESLAKLVVDGAKPGVRTCVRGGRDTVSRIH